MRTRMYGGVRGRKTKVGGKSTFVFLLLDLIEYEKSSPFLNCFLKYCLLPFRDWLLKDVAYEVVVHLVNLER